MHNLSEDDISVKYITPALIKSGWDEAAQIRRQVSFTNGRIIVRGKLVSRGKAKYVKKVEDEQALQAGLRAVEKKQLSHRACATS